MKWSALAFLLFAFAAGGAFGYLVGAGGHGGDDGGALGSTDSGVVRRPAPAAPEASGLPAPSGHGATLTRALADVPVERAPSGTGTISGTVLTEDGRPLSGVLVRAIPQVERGQRSWVRGGGPPEEKDLETALREYAASYRLRIASRHDAMTDAEGRYTVSGLSADPHYLQAWLDGYEIRRSQQSPGRAHAGDTVDFTAKELGTIPITVLLPDGTTAETATIQCARSNQSMSVPWDRKTGSIRLDSAAWRLSASGGEDNAYRSEEVAIVVDPGETVREVTLALADRPGIRGTVRFEEPGEVFQGLIVSLRLAPGEAPDPAKLKSVSSSTWVHSGMQPKFTIPDLQPGTWLVGARANGGGDVVAFATVEVVDRTVDLELVVPAPTPDQYVTVALEGPDGGPVSDARIYTDASSSRGRNQGYRATHRPDGTWRVFHPSPPGGGSDEPTTWRIHAYSSRFGTKTVEYVPGREARIEIRFDEPAFLEVEVTGLDAPGAPGSASVSLQPADPGSQQRYSPYGQGNSTAVKGGKATLGPVSPGSYRLRLTANDRGYGGGSALAEVTLDLGPGQNHESIAMPALYSLTVIVPENATPPIRYLTLRPKNRDSGATWSGSARPDGGKALFERVPAGEYRLRSSGQGGGVMDVTVPGPGVVNFTPRAVNALAVHIREATGTIAKAGLREGDLIVSIDGTEFKTETQINALQMLAREKPTAQLGVLRGNGRIQVAVDFSAIRGREAGGWFEPVAR